MIGSLHNRLSAASKLQVLRENYLAREGRLTVEEIEMLFDLAEVQQGQIGEAENWRTEAETTIERLLRATQTSGGPGDEAVIRAAIRPALAGLVYTEDEEESAEEVSQRAASVLSWLEAWQAYREQHDWGTERMCEFLETPWKVQS